MLWRYVIGGGGILLFLLAFYPAFESETLILILYAAGLASLFYGLLTSPPAPDPAWTLPGRPVKEVPDASEREYPSANPWFPVILIGGAAIGLLVVGIVVVGVFLLAIDNHPGSSYASENPGPELFFINYDSGKTRWILRDGDRVNISGSRYVLVSREGFREWQDPAWITITPVAPLHLITTGVNNDTFWIETIQNEGEELRFRYNVDLPEGGTCTLPDSGNSGQCSSGPAGDGDAGLREDGYGGMELIVRGTGIARYGPPVVSDARGEYRTLSYKIDGDARTISIGGDTGGLEYPLYWTLPL